MDECDVVCSVVVWWVYGLDAREAPWPSAGGRGVCEVRAQDPIDFLLEAASVCLRPNPWRRRPCIH